MKGLTNLEAKRLLLRAVAEAEWSLAAPGEILSERRHKPTVRARHICWLIAVDELGLGYSALGRWVDRDHTTVMSGVARARAHVREEPWAGLHADLLDLVRSGRRLPEPVSQPLRPIRRGGDDVWPGRDWYEAQNAAFVRAMRRAHPEREIEIGRAEHE